MALDTKLRYPHEQPLFVRGIVFSALAWLALAVMGIFYGLLGLLFTLWPMPSSWPT